MCGFRLQRVEDPRLVVRCEAFYFAQGKDTFREFKFNTRMSKACEYFSQNSQVCFPIGRKTVQSYD